MAGRCGGATCAQGASDIFAGAGFHDETNDRAGRGVAPNQSPAFGDVNRQAAPGMTGSIVRLFRPLQNWGWAQAGTFFETLRARGLFGTRPESPLVFLIRERYMPMKEVVKDGRPSLENRLSSFGKRSRGPGDGFSFVIPPADPSWDEVHVSSISSGGSFVQILRNFYQVTPDEARIFLAATQEGLERFKPGMPWDRQNVVNCLYDQLRRGTLVVRVRDGDGSLADSSRTGTTVWWGFRREVGRR